MRLTSAMRFAALAIAVLVSGSLERPAIWAEEPGAAGNQPSLSIAKIEQSPIIDGKLDDACWQQAAQATSFRPVASQKAPSQPTEAWLACDGQWLYIAFRCHDSRISDLVIRETIRDGAVSSDDSVEVFLDHGTGGKIYFHFQLNAGNVQADQLVKRGARKRDWDAGWRSAVQVDPNPKTAKCWSAEMAIPLYIFARKGGSQPWRMNLNRNKRTSPAESSSWSPVNRSFHEPQSFGFVKGLAEISPRPLFAPMIASSQVSQYRFIEGEYFYEVFGMIENQSDLGGTIELVAEDRPKEGRPAKATQTIALTPAETKEFRVSLPVARPGDRTAWVSLRDPQTGTSWPPIRVAGMQALTPMRAYLDRNYYTTEQNARAIVILSMTESERRKAGLRLSASLVGENGKVRSSRQIAIASEEVSTELPIGDLPPGRHQVRLQLRDRSGATIGGVELSLDKHPPAPAGVTEVKVDQVNRCLLLNGKPFFPVGIVSLAMDPVSFKMYQEAGFNTVLRWGWGGAISPEIDRLDEARRHGLYVIEPPLSFLKKWRNLSYGSPTFREQFSLATQDIPDFIRTVRTHPAVIAYYGVDEPNLASLPGEGKSLHELLLDFYNMVHGLDPYHPVYISGSRRIGSPDWYEIADVLGVHIYWDPVVGIIPEHDYMSHRPNYMSKCTEAARQITETRQRPLLIMPQGEIYSGSRRPHTPRERRLNVYLALIHGAKSIIYFASPIRHRLNYESMKELSAELQALAPALLTRTPPQEIMVDPAPVPPEESPIVQALFKDRPEGGALLLAANSSWHPVQAKWDLSALGEGLRVSDFSSKKPFELHKSVFTDHLEGYGTRVYLIAGGNRKRGAKAIVRLSLSSEAVDRMNLVHQPVKKPSRNKNLLANSSFEEAALPGWPDCWAVGPLRLGQMVGDPGAPGQDDTFAYHGKYSLKILNPYRNVVKGVRIPYKHPYPLTKRRWSGVPVERGRTYVFSVYLRSDKEGSKARLMVYNYFGGHWKTASLQETVELTTEWQRYQLVCPIPEAKGQSWLAVNIRILHHGTSAIWIDAAQFELGETATPYQPDSYQALPR